MVAARVDSMSCSVTAQANASQAFGVRLTRYPGIRLISGRSSGCDRKRRMNGRMSSSTREGVADPLDRDLELGAGGGLALRAGEPGARRGHRGDRDLAAVALPGAGEDRAPGDVEEALVDAVAGAGDRVGEPAPAGEAEETRRAHLDDQRPSRAAGQAI